MNRKRILWTAPILLGILLALLLAGSALYPQLRQALLYAAAERAAGAGHWAAAFSHWHDLLELDPTSGEARRHLETALDPIVESLPWAEDLEEEIDLLRWLAASGHLEHLAAALDHCAIRVPAGWFTMGSDRHREDERPQRQVYLDAYTIDRYEVTNVQYQRFIQETGRPAPPYWPGGAYPAGQADYPVVGVTWLEADAYCTWAGRRLPSEAEWEKACGGVEGRLYPWGEAWNASLANVDPRNEGVRPTPWSGARETAWIILQATPSADGHGPRPIGCYPGGASVYGVLDLAGNVSEWVADWYNWSGYTELPAENPVGQGPQWNHVVRGSSWYEPFGAADQAEEHSRCSSRNSAHVAHDPRVGFRCARSLGDL